MHPTIAAVLTPCSASKRKLSAPTLEAARQLSGPQVAVAERWLSGLAAASVLTPAQDLYVGTSYSRVRRVAEDAGSSLFIVSAGLGLLEGSTRVPSYDLTLSPSAPARIQSRITDRFDATVWWQQMQRGRFATAMEAIATGDGRILVALTMPYAQLIGAALSELPSLARSRLRIFGAGLKSSLDASLHTNVMPYDARLNAVMPGTRLDFSSRALAHLAELVALRPLQDAGADAELVRATLAPAAAPTSTTRPKLTDAELLKHIEVLVRRGLSKTSALRELRERMGLACEQSRFARLYGSVST